MLNMYIYTFINIYLRKTKNLTVIMVINTKIAVLPGGSCFQLLFYSASRCLFNFFLKHLRVEGQSGNDARMRIIIFHKTKWRQARGTAWKWRNYIHCHKQEK